MMIDFDASRLLPWMGASMLCMILACVFLGIGIYKMHKQKKNGGKPHGARMYIILSILLLLLGMGMLHYLRTNL